MLAGLCHTNIIVLGGSVTSGRSCLNKKSKVSKKTCAWPARLRTILEAHNCQPTIVNAACGGCGVEIAYQRALGYLTGRLSLPASSADDNQTNPTGALASSLLFIISTTTNDGATQRFWNTSSFGPVQLHLERLLRMILRHGSRAILFEDLGRERGLAEPLAEQVCFLHV